MNVEPFTKLRKEIMSRQKDILFALEVDFFLSLSRSVGDDSQNVAHHNWDSSQSNRNKFYWNLRTGAIERKEEKKYESVRAR